MDRTMDQNTNRNRKSKAARLCAAALALLLAGCTAGPGAAGGGQTPEQAAQTAPPETAPAQPAQHPGEALVLARQYTSGADGSVYETIFYRYDPAGRLIEEVTVGANRLRYEYDDAGNRVRQSRTDRYGVILRDEIVSKYDEAGDLIAREFWYGGQCQNTETYRYSDAGGGARRVESFSQDGELIRTELLDAQGRVVETRHAGSTDDPMRTEYDEYGNATLESYRRYEYAYQNGRAVTRIQRAEDGALLARTDFVYAPLDDTLAELAPSGVPVQNAEEFAGIEPPQYRLYWNDQLHYWTTAESGLILRSGPGTEYDRLDSIPCQTEIPMVGYTDGLTGWFVTEYDGQYGWVSADYVE